MGTLPATRPEDREVGALVSPGTVVETRPRPALGRLLLRAHLSGVSVHRRLGRFGAGIRRRGVRRRRLERGLFEAGTEKLSATGWEAEHAREKTPTKTRQPEKQRH
jgi:hypothetical protein